ncbi:glycosyltransferase family 4 protein [Flavobacterium sp. XGLA_31]|uniref:glycosyltransferase family 4 protein n=1 Tax=Flavobacterium sp. XGLA_31 TaxID=3447666 RepID=UPI003F311E82
MKKQKLIRITTVPISLDKLLTGQLRFMSAYYEVTAVSSEKENLEKIGKKEGVKTFHVEMSRKITPLADLLAVFRLFLFLRKEKPLIVHSHTPKAGIVGMLAARLAGVPNRLHTVAGLPLLETTGLKRKILDGVEKLTYALATKVYPNSQGLQEIIIQNNYCKATKLKVIANGSSNGIDTDFFTPTLYSDESKNILRKQLAIAETDFVFVFVGRLVKDKGLNEMIAAFELLQKTYSHAKLLLVGDYETDLDPLFPETMTVIQQNENIISVGFQYDVRPYFSIAKVLVFPSYREGFPNVVMQAGAMALPCIVSDINGCNEIIEEGINGTIIPVKNKEVLLEKMTLLMENQEWYLQLQRNSRPMITSRYDQKVVWESILAEYRNL